MPQSFALTVLRAAAAVSGVGLCGCGASPGASTVTAGPDGAPGRVSPRMVAAYRVEPAAAPSRAPVTCWVQATFGRSGPDAKGLRMLAVARICVPAPGPEPPG